MNKQETIDAIENARKAHIKQMDNIKALIEGKEVNTLTPVSKMKCQFGQWLYGDNEKVENILGAQFYENLDVIHETWHIQYAKIHAIFIGEKKKGLLSKIFGSHKRDTLEIEKTKVYYKDLEETTTELLRALDASHRRVQALSESKFH